MNKIAILGSTGSIGLTTLQIVRKNKKNFKIIFTGGLSHLYKDTLKNKVNVDRDLTIKGLLRLIDLI